MNTRTWLWRTVTISLVSMMLLISSAYVTTCPIADRVTGDCERSQEVG